MNYKHLLWKYINHIGDMEGYTYIFSNRFDVLEGFTDQEKKALRELDDMVKFLDDPVSEVEKDDLLLEDINEHVFLRRGRLNDFIAWLDKKDIPHRSGKGGYQALQVIYEGKPHPLYISDHYPQDYKAIKPLNYLVKKFFKESHE